VLQRPGRHYILSIVVWLHSRVVALTFFYFDYYSLYLGTCTSACIAQTVISWPLPSLDRQDVAEKEDQCIQLYQVTASCPKDVESEFVCACGQGSSIEHAILLAT
jgi:hypothetical protein